MKILDFSYVFDFPGGVSKRIDVCLNSETLNVILPERQNVPLWCGLDFEKCEICKLKQEPFCPLALALVEIVEKFGDASSTEVVNVTAKIPGRTVSGEMPLQKGLSSVVGALMAGSLCPEMKMLKAMLNFHLPFASVDETVFRSVSSYLLGQYFVHKEGGKADMELSGLRETYENIEKINNGMACRLRSAVKKDANLNAVVILDVFAKYIPLSIGNSLNFFSYLYNKTG